VDDTYGVKKYCELANGNVNYLRARYDKGSDTYQPHFDALERAIILKHSNAALIIVDALMKQGFSVLDIKCQSSFENLPGSLSIYEFASHANANNILAGLLERCTPQEILILKLDKYITKRASFKNWYDNNTTEYFYPFFIPYQKSFSEKKEAVTILKKALQGEQVDLKPHLETLQNGSLANIITNFLTNHPIDRHDTGRIQTIEELVEISSTTLETPHSSH
jgi:hypothetical protein